MNEKLNVSNRNLKELDLSKNTDLKWLDCENNPNLKEIILHKGQVIGSLRKDEHTKITYI